MATKSDERTWLRSSASEASKFAVVTVFRGNADPHAVVEVEELRARESARVSAEEGRLCGFIVYLCCCILRPGFRRGITKAEKGYRSE